MHIDRDVATNRQNGMSRSRLTRTALLFAAMVACAAPAVAAPVTITPTTIALSPEHMTALVTLTNESDGPARFETSLHAWRQAPDGTTVLEPNNDVVVFPQLITLQPREVKKVRVGTERPVGAVERSYRLILQELPQFNAQNGRVQIEVLSKISLPVFVAPRESQPKAAVSPPTLKNGILSFDVANAGSAHFVLREVEVTGRASSGESFSVKAPGWYVLAGERQAFEVALSAADCRRASELTVRAMGTMPTAETRMPVAADACGKAPQSQFQKIATSSAAPPS